MRKLILPVALATILFPAATKAEPHELPAEPTEIKAAFDLSRPMLLREDTRLPTDPAPPRPDASPAEKRLAQLERAASEATTVHAFGRLAEQAERLGYDEPSVRDAAFRLASWAYTSRGRARIQSGRDESAMEDFDRALELTPGAPSPLHERAVTLAEWGDDRAALEALDSVIMAEPDWVAARQNRAMVLLRLGEDKAALADCLHALKLTDGEDRSQLHEQAGRALQRIGRRRESARHVERGLAVAPNDPGLLTLRGDLSAELGLVERAVDDYFAVLESDPADPEVYRRLAWLLATAPDESLRDPQLAMESAARARRFGYDADLLTLDASAAAHAAAGDYAAAVRFQQRAILVAGEGATREMSERLALYRGEESYVAEKAGAGAADSKVLPAAYQKRAGGR